MKNALLLVLAATVFGGIFAMPVLAEQPAQTAVQNEAPLPDGVKVVWDLDKAFRQRTATREHVCINGLWRWQPAKADAEKDKIPETGWGFMKVPGPWSSRENQALIAHPDWKDLKTPVDTAWYQREITIPEDWKDKRIAVYAEYVNSFATVYVDGKKAGELRFPSGELNLTAFCKPGQKHLLSLQVVAMPLNAVLLSHLDSDGAKMVKGSVGRKGLCGDVSLIATPIDERNKEATRVADVKIDTSYRKGEITFDVEVQGIPWNLEYQLRAQITDGGKQVAEFTSKPFILEDRKAGRIAFTEKWKPEKLWDTHTPKNTYEANISILSLEGKVLDTALPVTFGFRELWIDGRDIYLNGSRVHLRCVPLDNAQISPYAATYEGTKESLLRLQSMGINFVYTHNYDCNPGSYLSFTEVLRAADDVGMLVSLSQPHYSHYNWDANDADARNGYATHAEFFVRVAQNHPSVVMYSTSHNSGGYSGDMDPELIDGKTNPRKYSWSRNTAQRALRAEAIIRGIDSSRVIYHHSSGNLGSMWTCNFYPNFVPIQELSDWFEIWATKGEAPAFTCEYGGPFTWDLTMFRGFHMERQPDGTQKLVRTFGSARVRWEFCLAEWNSQFFGDKSFDIGEREKNNLRFESKKMKIGEGLDKKIAIASEQLREALKAHPDLKEQIFKTRKESDPPLSLPEPVAKAKADLDALLKTETFSVWHRWDYPEVVGSKNYVEQFPVIAKYYTENWRSYRTWGVTAISPWEHHIMHRMRPDLNRNAMTPLKVDWENIQRPGYSIDHLAGRSERMDTAYERADWIPNVAAEAMYRNNMPLLAYIGGKPARFTSRDHNFYPGEKFEKQLIIINDSRVVQDCDCEWSLALPQAVKGAKKVSVKPGEQERVLLSFEVPAGTTAGQYELSASVKFSGGEAQKDTFAVHVLAPAPAAKLGKTALFDPKGETGTLLAAIGVQCESVAANADLAAFDTLIVGKGAFTADGAGPDVSRVREGLKVIVFEQTSEALEKRFGFRVQEYGLRDAYPRIPDHPALAGLKTENLRDWAGEATIMASRLKMENSDVHKGYKGATVTMWCGMEIPRLYRCGNRGNVASVLIEKPARGDFLPLIDGGYSLQYSPLMEYREGKGVVLFCQMDVTGRTEKDPAADTLTRNILKYVSTWKPGPSRTVLYAGDAAGKAHLEKSGIAAAPFDGSALSAEQVIVAGPGAGEKLAANNAAIAAWLKNGGNLLALGLDDAEANTFLPFKIATKKAEHIAAYFEAPGSASPFAGIGPADIHNRDPREFPLIAEGAAPTANGVLAKAENANVVFCQMLPWQFTYTMPQNIKRTFRRSSCTLTRLLGNMGVSGNTPLLARFKTPVSAAKPEQRWLDGFYLDTPEAWDDPYRCFRW